MHALHLEFKTSASPDVESAIAAIEELQRSEDYEDCTSASWFRGKSRKVKCEVVLGRLKAISGKPIPDRDWLWDATLAIVNELKALNPDGNQGRESLTHDVARFYLAYATGWVFAGVEYLAGAAARAAACATWDSIRKQTRCLVESDLDFLRRLQGKLPEMIEGFGDEAQNYRDTQERIRNYTE